MASSEKHFAALLQDSSDDSSDEDKEVSPIQRVPPSKSSAFAHLLQSSDESIQDEDEEVTVEKVVNNPYPQYQPDDDDDEESSSADEEVLVEKVVHNPYPRYEPDDDDDEEDDDDDDEDSGDGNKDESTSIHGNNNQNSLRERPIQNDTDLTLSPIDSVSFSSTFLDGVDNYIDDYLQDRWKGSVPMDLFRFNDNDRTKLNVDVCSIMGSRARGQRTQGETINVPHQQCRPQGPYTNSSSQCNFYFDPYEYPPPAKGLAKLPRNDPTFTKLSKHIMRFFLQGGSPVFSNGCHTKKGFNRRFDCKFCNRQYKPSKKMSTGTPKKYRQDRLINTDKSGRRKNGRSLCRRTSTTKATEPGKTCNFRLVIAWDDIGYYVSVKNGNPYHCHHPPLDADSLPMPTYLLPESEKENLLHLADACVGAGAGRNFIFSKLGKHISNAKVAYLQGGTPKKPPKGLDFSDIDHLLVFLKESKEVTYEVLWDCPRLGIPVTETSPNPTTPAHKNDHSLSTPTALYSTRRPAGASEEEFIDHSGDLYMRPLQEQTWTQRRNDPSMDVNAKIFVSIAWATKDELRLFRLFPEVLHCDATSDTNNTKNHLLTFSGRTSTGKQFIFLRVWLHNQKQEAFRWVFKRMLQSFFPALTLQRVQMIMVDGDPQQHREILNAMQSYMRNAHLSHCGWHIVHQGWKRHGPVMNGVEGARAREVFLNFKKTVTDWCFSFMKPGFCEDEDEYELSKNVFFSYLRSNEAKEACATIGNQELVRKFIKGYVIIHDNFFLYYQRKRKRHFWVANNSAHEGTNFGIKSSAATVRPCHSLDKAGKALTLQGNLKTLSIAQDSTMSILTKNLWSKTETTDKITTMAESDLCQVLGRMQKYEVKQISSSTWQVRLRRNGKENTQRNDARPVFQRVRQITLLPLAQRLICSCCKFESTGLPCVHQGATIKFHFPGWKSFTHRDVSVRWWQVYMNYGQSEKYSNMSMLLEKVRRNDIVGPAFPGTPPAQGTYSEPWPILPAKERVVNYSVEELDRMLPPAITIGPRRLQYNDGQTQETYAPDGPDNNDDGWESFNLEGDLDDNTNDGIDDGVDHLPGSQIETIHSSARERIKHHVNELIGCLETADDNACYQIAERAINGAVTEIRKRIAVREAKLGRRKKCRTVNLMTEQQKTSVRRVYASRNC